MFLSAVLGIFMFLSDVFSRVFRRLNTIAALALNQEGEIL